MGAQLLDGAAVARAIRAEVAGEVEEYRRRRGSAPKLVAVLVGDDPASTVYVRNKVAACGEVGLRSEEVRFPATVPQEVLLDRIGALNADPDVDGILVQLPLPKGLERIPVLLAIDPQKDVDGLHPANSGRLLMNLPAPVPCTPAGVIELLDRYRIPIRGRRAVIVGRSEIVGKPLAVLLLQRDATVTICHSKTDDLPGVTRQADILVAAIGRPAFIRAEHIRPGAAVVDVGINRVDDAGLAASYLGKDSPRLRLMRERGFVLIGDVHPVEGMAQAGHLSPVPGGVGPLTIACLLRNTLRVARARREGAAR